MADTITNLIRIPGVRAPADALRQVKAEAFDEGAQFAWGESGEGWNGEYPPGESPDFASHNPYRQEQTDGQ